MSYNNILSNEQSYSHIYKMWNDFDLNVSSGDVIAEYDISPIGQSTYYWTFPYERKFNESLFIENMCSLEIKELLRNNWSVVRYLLNASFMK